MATNATWEYEYSPWAPIYNIVDGEITVVRAVLHVSSVPLLISCLSLLALFLVSAFSIGRIRRHGATVRDGRLIDMMVLLCSSSLPAVIGGTVETERRPYSQLRQAAEVTIVTSENNYRNSETRRF